MPNEGWAGSAGMCWAATVGEHRWELRMKSLATIVDTASANKGPQQLLSQLFERASTDAVAERGDANQEPSPPDEANPQSTGAASAATGHEAEVEGAEP